MPFKLDHFIKSLKFKLLKVKQIANLISLVLNQLYYLNKSVYIHKYKKWLGVAITKQ